MAVAKTETVTTKIVDFSNVKEGGATFMKKRVPSGDYLARVTKVQDSPAKDGIHQWLYTVVLENKFSDRKFPYYCKLQENQLWKLRNLFLAAGIPVPKKKFKLDPSRIVGKLIAVTMEDDEYEGKAQSNVASVFPASELSENDTEIDEDETEVDDEDDEDDEEDEDTDDEADDDEDEEEEEEEEPVPAPKKAAAKKAAVPAQRSAATKKSSRPTVTDEELEELDLDDI